MKPIKIFLLTLTAIFAFSTISTAQQSQRLSGNIFHTHYTNANVRIDSATTTHLDSVFVPSYATLYAGDGIAGQVIVGQDSGYTVSMGLSRTTGSTTSVGDTLTVKNSFNYNVTMLTDTSVLITIQNGYGSRTFPALVHPASNSTGYYVYINARRHRVVGSVYAQYIKFYEDYAFYRVQISK